MVVWFFNLEIFANIWDMKILIVAATWMEVKLIADEFEFINEESQFLTKYQYSGNEIDILRTGIGTTFATFHLTNTLHSYNYQLVINVGIAGSFTPDLKIGDVVNVMSEEFADLGIEDKEQFFTLFESGFLDGNDFPFENGLLKATNSNGLLLFSKVRGITANKSHGHSTSIAALNEKFSAHIESMEGAAVFYVCKWFGLPCYQIRGISNYVAPRDPSQWNIPLALENLKKSMLEVLQKVSVPVA